jgi:hypothetical protein
MDVLGHITYLDQSHAIMMNSSPLHVNASAARKRHLLSLPGPRRRVLTTLASPGRSSSRAHDRGRALGGRPLRPSSERPLRLPQSRRKGTGSRPQHWPVRTSRARPAPRVDASSPIRCRRGGKALGLEQELIDGRGRSISTAILYEVARDEGALAGGGDHGADRSPPRARQRHPVLVQDDRARAHRGRRSRPCP